MAKQFPSLDPKHKAFIAAQKIFFTASCAANARVNISPRSTDAFRVISDTAVLYLDRTGSGNETAAHLQADGRLTIMLCSFEGPPQIMRLYGRGRAVHLRDEEFKSLIDSQFDGHSPLGTRQLIYLDIDLVQTSCGFGVPLFDYQGERDTMDKWANNKGEQGIETYRSENNRVSMDGLPTGLFSDS